MKKNLLLIFIFFSGLLTVSGCKTKQKASSDIEASKKIEVQEIPTENKNETDEKQNEQEKISASSVYFDNLPEPRSELPINLLGPKTPSVLLVVLDAVNVKHLSAYGYNRNTTPNIDKLALKGGLFTQYISNSSWTRPSFTSIITGLPKKNHRIELAKKDLDKDIKSLAWYFRQEGYKTAGLVGNPLVRGIWGFNQGYQLYKDTHDYGSAFPPDARITDDALKWLSQIKDDPFFLKLFYTAPHTPYRPPAKARHFVNQIKEGNVIEYPFREYKHPLAKADHEKTVAAYDDEIRYADSELGRVLEFLEKSGRADSTVIAIVSDHGEVFGDHNCYQHTYHMWEAALRVPFILYVPWAGQEGYIDDRPYTHIDIMPTLLDLTHIEYNKKALPGRSIVADLQNFNDNQERILLASYNAHGIRRESIRDNRWKLIHHHKVEKSALSKINRLQGDVPHENPEDLATLALDGERFELYNMLTDPGELNNKYEKMIDSAELLALLDALIPEIQADQETSALSEELEEALRAAGYIN